MEPVKVNKQKERDFLTEEEFEALIEAIRQPVIKTVVQDHVLVLVGEYQKIVNLN